MRLSEDFGAQGVTPSFKMGIPVSCEVDSSHKCRSPLKGGCAEGNLKNAI